MEIRKIIITAAILLNGSGCEGIRFAPDEQQKQNAWVHNRTAVIAAQAAKDEYASQRLQALTDLCSLQSRAFLEYYGLPDKLPEAETAEDVLRIENRQLAEAAIEQAGQRPDVWQAADSALELGIGLAGILGGAAGVRLARYLQQARARTNALREIVLANEIFKKTNPAAAEAFKEAHSRQSAMTRQIVTEIKT